MDQKREYTLEDFVLQKKIGEGSFGSVYRASNLSTGETVAIKKIKLSAANRAEIKNVAHEVRVLCSIDHRHVVSYKGSFWDKGQTHICIVMEYLGGGDLSVKIANLKKKRQLMAEDQIWTYFIQMLKGLKVLHDLKIIHRDIKAANVFLTQDEREVKLGDMNVSKVVEKDFTKTRVGTPLYFSPEIWNGRSYDYKTDVWSLGCLLYEMAALTYPFNGNSMNDLRFCASKGRYAPIPSMYSKDLNEIIRQCLQVDDSKRPTVTKLLDSPIIRERVKRIDNLTVTDLKNVESKLIDTIQIPFDFRKIKLPMKKDIIQGTVDPQQAEEIKTRKTMVNSDDLVFIVNMPPVPQDPSLIVKSPKLCNPPPRPPTSLAQKPLQPLGLPRAPAAPLSGRRLSGDYSSNQQTPRGQGSINIRPPSPQLPSRVPSAQQAPPRPQRLI